MAMPSKRSPSPLSSRPNPPHSRNTESNSTTRRSCSGGNPFHRPSILTHSKSFNPVTPANSPAGFGRRNSVGKEGMGQLLSCEEKENEKDQILKSLKVRSPANGSKNFMSPTISAASKFTPSPRKKPLVERNEQVRTSISLSDGKATFFSAISSDNTEDLVPKSEEKKVEKGCLDSNVSHLDQNEAVLECLPVSKAMKKVTFAELPSGLPSTSSDTVIIDSDCFDVENNNLQNMTSSFSVSPIVAPLDADPSVPPYDPKLNYLSPRPQFLHYKPNPRIELLLQNKEKVLDSEIKRLDDSSILESSSETFSDTDCAEESNSSAEIVEPEVNEEEEAGSLSDKSDISAPISYETTEEKTVAGKRSFFPSMKFASLLLVFLIGVISISIPAMNSSILKNSDFSELHLPSGVADMAKANFYAYTRRFKMLSFDSIYRLSLLVKNLGGHDNLRAPQFINLTDLQKDDVSVGWKMHTYPVFVEKFSHGVCENAIGGKKAEKFTGDFEKKNVEVPEDGESLPSEEDDTTYLDSDDPSESYISAPEIQMEESEIYVEVVSDDTRETEIDGEIDMGNQEFTFTAKQPVQQMEESDEVVSDDTHETGTDGEMDMGNQELTSSPAPVQQIEEFETHVEFDDTPQTGIDGKIDPGNQELTSLPTPDHQMQEPLVSFETVWGQEAEAASKVVEEKTIESVNEEKISEIQPELLENTKLEAAATDDLDDFGPKIEPSIVIAADTTPLEMIKSPIGSSIVVLLLALISAAAYAYSNRVSTSSSTISSSNRDSVVLNDQFLLSNKKIIPEISVREPETTWSREVMMEEEESCSSEMSSFQTKPSLSSYNYSSSSRSRLLKTANDEADQKSQERRRKLRKQSKRESLASSSSEFSKGCSPSYGSFTTYEKITCKNATTGDDEIMTPVRRSSRIRNLATSP